MNWWSNPFLRGVVLGFVPAMALYVVSRRVRKFMTGPGGIVLLVASVYVLWRFW